MLKMMLWNFRRKFSSAIFNEKGVFVVEKFLNHEQINEMRRDIDDVVQSFDVKAHRRRIFDTDHQNHAGGKDKIFINSSDSVEYFLEKDAFDKNGNLTVTEKGSAINKIGHGLHLSRPLFRKNTFTPKTIAIARSLGYHRPVVVQSMYIFKQPFIGDQVVPHQDATFLYVDPCPEKLFALWIALDDANQSNGCLWYAPGSHKMGLVNNNRFIRQVDPTTNDVSLKFTGPWPMPNVDRLKFEPIEVKAGDAVVIHGLVIHKSERNFSDKSRNAYTIHFAESDGVKWDPKNWLQPIRGPFSRLY